MSDLYHDLLDARHALTLNDEERLAAAQSRACDTLKHVLTLAMEADILRVIVRDPEERFVVFSANELSVMEEHALLIGCGSHVIGRTREIPKILAGDPSVEGTCENPSPASAFARAAGDAAVLNHPRVIASLDALRAQAARLRARGDTDGAASIDTIITQLDVEPIGRR